LERAHFILAPQAFADPSEADSGGIRLVLPTPMPADLTGVPECPTSAVMRKWLLHA